MDRITKAHPLGFCNIRIARCLPELHKIDLDVDVRLRQAGVLQVRFYVVSQLRFRRLFLKLAGTVQNRDLFKRPIISMVHTSPAVQRACRPLVLPVRMYTCDHIFNGSFHLKMTGFCMQNVIFTPIGTACPWSMAVYISHLFVAVSAWSRPCHRGIRAHAVCNRERGSESTFVQKENGQSVVVWLSGCHCRLTSTENGETVMKFSGTVMSGHL